MPQTRMPTDTNWRATTVKNLENTETSVACWKDRKKRLKAHKLVQETKPVEPTTLS